MPLVICPGPGVQVGPGSVPVGESDGVGESVGDGICVSVAVRVGVRVGVDVGIGVGVDVAVAVGVGVGVRIRKSTWLGRLQLSKARQARIVKRQVRRSESGGIEMTLRMAC